MRTNKSAGGQAAGPQQLQMKWKRWKKDYIAVCALCAALCLPLAACGDEAGAPEPPAAYEIGGEHIPSLDESLGEEGYELTAAEAPVEGAEPEAYQYTYAGLPSGGLAVGEYAALLTGEDYGFEPVDGTGGAAEAPDYTAEEGAVVLARPAEEEGRILRLSLAWTATGCTVELERPAGSVARPAQPMTNNDAVAFLKELSPTQLGLEGESMGPYLVYPVEGQVLVDGVPCLRLNVYLRDGAQVNRIVGTYMLTGDRRHLYRLEPGGSGVAALALPQ